MKADTKKTKSAVIRGVPLTLFKKFKAKCAIQDVSMNKKIIELIREFVHEKE